ncbi:helix-turn-helix domain-containing protein [Marinospirillum perlucidum]|uniref:helix-turn-helix domain-containing protein n=1 Tax=Marinospirillum perlucidum TaxID=1982602 RepID=UPI0013903913|nr:helix-turn-helix transcriptional regulator [Marinospirillum perlucidum]
MNRFEPDPPGLMSETERLERLAESQGGQSWADYGSCQPRHEQLVPFVASYTYSVGCIYEQEAHFITRAYPTIMTQLYFEFYGDLSEVKDDQGFFAFDSARASSQSRAIRKRTYVKQGLGSWFDIYQLPSKRTCRPIKNLKIDLFPNTLYQLFQISPQEVWKEDLQLADLLGATSASLMLERMEAAVSGLQLVAIAEEYLLKQLASRESTLDAGSRLFTSLPDLNGSLGQQANYFNKSERWLQKQYQEIYGMSFKKMQTNLKFQYAHGLLQKAIEEQQPINLTQLAYHCGYFDQAHFIRDFKRFAGMTPGAYLKSHAGETSQLFYW